MGVLGNTKLSPSNSVPDPATGTIISVVALKSFNATILDLMVSSM